MERMPLNSGLGIELSRRARLLYQYDPYTFSHSLRVAALSGRIAESLSLSDRQVKRTWVAALMHDIGKIFVPKTILNKPDDLTANERGHMRWHTLYGYFSLSRSPVFNGIKEIVLLHHERYDGLGYPFGLKGENIPIESRILSVADTFDAITSRRVYQHAVPADKALLEINNNAYGMFDPVVVDHFNRVVNRFHEYDTDVSLNAT